MISLLKFTSRPKRISWTYHHKPGLQMEAMGKDPELFSQIPSNGLHSHLTGCPCLQGKLEKVVWAKNAIPSL